MDNDKSSSSNAAAIFDSQDRVRSRRGLGGRWKPNCAYSNMRAFKYDDGHFLALRCMPAIQAPSTGSCNESIRQ